MTFHSKLEVSVIRCRSLLLTGLLYFPRQSRAFLAVSLKTIPVSASDRDSVVGEHFLSPLRHQRIAQARDRYTVAASATRQQKHSRSGRKPTAISSVLAYATSGGGGCEMVDDHHERALQVHVTMPGDGKEERLQHPSRDAHNRRQAAVFDAKSDFFSSEDATPPEVMPFVRKIAEACRPQDADDICSSSSSVVDVGCGTGALVTFLKGMGVPEENVIGVDLSSKMITVFRERFPKAEAVNVDFIDFAQSLLAARKQALLAMASTKTKEETAPIDEGGRKSAEISRATKAVKVVVFNAVFGNLWNQGAALELAGEILEEGGKVVISHALGRNFVRRLKCADDTVVPHELPDKDTLQQLVEFLPLGIESFESEEDIYLTVLKRMPHRACSTVRYLRGKVSRGYGRGSKTLGVPTANLLESQFAENLRSLTTGVYFGWASLERREPSSGVNEGPWKCVANVGYSPTFAGEENAEKIVEGHLIGYEGGDFYGKTMRIVLVGFQRYETKFASFPELVMTIKKDVANASNALDEPRFAIFKGDEHFSSSGSLEAWSTREFKSATKGVS